MPNEDCIFFGDSVNAPYGTKELSQIPGNRNGQGGVSLIQRGLKLWWWPAIRQPALQSGFSGTDPEIFR